MIKVKDNFSILEDDTMASASFKIKDKDVHKVFTILRSSMYSDPILACLREYACNASDSHKEVGCPKRAISVQLPTIYEPTLRIRDFGTGLSEDSIFNVFACYGASSKEDSNEYVGMLGMGSKSGFAYAESFTIESWFDGVKKTYAAYIDESEVGKISKTCEEKCDINERGICISIPVAKNDINTFIETAKKFFLWYSPEPEFSGYSLSKDIKAYKDKLDIVHDSDSCTIYSESYYYGGSATNLFVKMGNICYPVLDKNGIDAEWLPNAYKCIIKVPIGSIEFTASRESISLKPYTLKTINDCLGKIKAEIALAFQKNVDAQPTAWDAICHYNSLSSLPKAVLKNALVWKGTTLSEKLPNNLEYCQYNSSNSRWKQTSVPYDQGTKIALIVNDGGFPPSQFRGRLMEAREQLKGKYSYVIFAKGTVTDVNALLASPIADGLPHIKLSTIAATAIIKNSKSAFAATEKVFKWKLTTQWPYSSCWESVDANGAKVYVELEAYKPVKYDWDTISDISNSLHGIGVQDFVLHGVKKGQKIHKNWVPLSTYLYNTAVKIMQDQAYIDEYVNRKVHEQINGNWFTKSILNGSYKNHISKVECPIAKEVMQLTSHTNSGSKYTYQQKLISRARNSGLTTDQLTKLDTMLAAMNNKANAQVKGINDKVDYCAKNYPLVANGYGSYYAAENAQAANLVYYINCVFKLKSMGL